MWPEGREVVCKSGVETNVQYEYTVRVHMPLFLIYSNCWYRQYTYKCTVKRVPKDIIFIIKTHK